MKPYFKEYLVFEGCSEGTDVYITEMIDLSEVLKITTHKDGSAELTYKNGQKFACYNAVSEIKADLLEYQALCWGEKTQAESYELNKRTCQYPSQQWLCTCGLSFRTQDTPCNHLCKEKHHSTWRCYCGSLYLEGIKYCNDCNSDRLI